MSGFFSSILNLIAHYGLGGVFVSMMIENIAIPFPTEGAFIVSQQLITHGYYSFWFMYWFIVFAQVLGSVISFWLGRTLGSVLQKRLAHRPKYQDVHAKIVGWYSRYGAITVFATRLIGYVRPWSSLVAGIARFPFWPFLGWTILGTMIFVFPTMHITNTTVYLWKTYPALQPVLAVVAIMLFFGAVLYGGARSFRKK